MKKKTIDCSSVWNIASNSHSLDTFVPSPITYRQMRKYLKQGVKEIILKIT